jgi:hypothetical protein
MELRERIRGYEAQVICASPVFLLTTFDNKRFLGIKLLSPYQILILVYHSYRGSREIGEGEGGCVMPKKLGGGEGSLSLSRAGRRRRGGPGKRHFRAGCNA